MKRAFQAFIDNPADSHFLATRRFYNETSTHPPSRPFRVSQPKRCKLHLYTIGTPTERQEAGDVARCISHLFSFVIG